MRVDPPDSTRPYKINLNSNKQESRRLLSRKSKDGDNSAAVLPNMISFRWRHIIISQRLQAAKISSLENSDGELLSFWKMKNCYLCAHTMINMVSMHTESTEIHLITEVHFNYHSNFLKCRTKSTEIRNKVTNLNVKM